MSTPKFDDLCIKFIKRIPTTFETAFTAGSGTMPDSLVLPADDIARYINEGMKTLFAKKWEEAFAYAKGKPDLAVKYFAGLFPELVKFSATLDTDDDLQGVAYVIDNPLLDLFQIIAGNGKDGQYIKVWDPSKFALASTGEYEEYTATEADPALIKVDNIIFTFPGNLTDWTFKIQYIKLPIDPTTGDPLLQNGDYDSPFYPIWTEQILDLAYEIYLLEAQETA